MFYPRENTIDQGYTTFGYMKMQMVVAHGGRCAERVVFGDDVTDGGKDDLEKITKVTIIFVYLVVGVYKKNKIWNGRVIHSSVVIYALTPQIGREMVISPQNARLGLARLTKRMGLSNRPDSFDGELIKYRVCVCSI